MTERAADHSSRSKVDDAATCVDVLIAARDRADTIERAVRSALAQEPVRAVIVVDDGSADDTAYRASCCEHDGKRVSVKRLRSSVGPAAARNVALEASTAPWLAILDGDDFFLPGRIEALLSNSNAWDFVADNLMQIPEEAASNLDDATTLAGTLSGTRALTLEQFVLGNVTQRGVARKELGFLKPLIRRKFIDSHQLRYDEALRLGEDYALYARALAAGARFVVLPLDGYVSIVRADSLSARHSRQDLERFRDSDCDLMALPTLTSRERRAIGKHYASVDCRVQWLNVIEGFKARSAKRFLAPFLKSPQISGYLAQKLMSEAIQRLVRLAGRAGRGQP